VERVYPDRQCAFRAFVVIDFLSFAQFEREVTGERIRDKVAASKRKGMWMGGPVPLGYDLLDRKLIPNHGEMATVRLIFERYLALGSIAELVIDLDRRGIRSKERSYANGRNCGGSPIVVALVSNSATIKLIS